MSTSATTSPAHRVVVVSAGLSAPSSSRLLADRLAGATTAELERGGHDVLVSTVELRDHALAVTRALLQGFAGPELEDVLESLATADGAIVVSPIFSASFSGLLKSFVDLLEPDRLAGLPLLLGATGGTERHSLALDFALRPLFAYHRAVVMPTGVFAATGDWGSTGTAAGGLGARITRAAAELAALVPVAARPRPVLSSFHPPQGAQGA